MCFPISLSPCAADRLLPREGQKKAYMVQNSRTHTHTHTHTQTHTHSKLLTGLVLFLQHVFSPSSSQYDALLLPSALHGFAVNICNLQRPLGLSK